MTRYRRFFAHAFLAACTGLLGSFALPAGILWMQGRGHVILVATAPLLFALSHHFQNAMNSGVRSTQTLATLAVGFLLAGIGCGSIEIGYFWWTSLGMQTFLGLAPLAALALAGGVIVAHSALGMGLVLTLLGASVVSGSWPRRVAALAFASLAGGWLESIAPRLFPYSLGSFLSLHPWTSPWLVAGGGALASAVVLFSGGALALGLSDSARVRAATLVTYATLLGVLELGWKPLGPAAASPQSASSAVRGAVVGPSENPIRELDVLLIQPAIAISKQILNGATSIEDRLAQQRAYELSNFESLVSLSKRALAQGSRPDLIVWPESLVAGRLQSDPQFRNHFEAALADFNVPVLAHIYETEFGDFPSTEPNGLPVAIRQLSLAKLLVPGGGEVPPSVYEKQALMPFGEYVPWLPVMERVLPRSTLARFPSHGDEDRLRPAGLMGVSVQGEAGTAMLAPQICFDGIFDSLGRAQAEAGADVILNLSNLEWLGSEVSENVFRSIVRLRGIETATSLVFVNNSGGTAAYGPSGQLIAGPLPHGISGFLRARIPLATVSAEGSRTQTPFVRTEGQVLPLLGMGGLIGLGVLLILRPRKALPPESKG